MSSFFGGGAGARKAAYNKADEAGASREERMARLKAELREHIRFLADYDLLSTDWLRMAESLHQIANVAFMETHLPPSDDNPLEQHGKKDTGTLWDQERDELAVRILLEEGKLNLALRILHRYRQALRDGDKFTALLKATSEKFHSDVNTVSERCKVFEQSVGILLQFAFSHVEALQIMDLPEFLQHASEVLTEAAASTRLATPLEVDKMQETLVLHYLDSMARRLEDMDEDRVMDLVQEHNIMSTTIAHLAKHYTWYKLDGLEAALRFLNGCMASEAYQADRAKFVSDKETVGQLLSLKALFLNEMLAATAAPASASGAAAAASAGSPKSTSGGYGFPKKSVQALLDEMARLERTNPGLSGVVKEAVPLRERLDKYRQAEIKEKEKQIAALAAAAGAGASGADKLKAATAK